MALFLITQPQIEQLMNLAAVAAAVALAVWEIRASKHQIGRTVTSVRQGQISDALEGGGKVICGLRVTALALGQFWVRPAKEVHRLVNFYRRAQHIHDQRNV